MRRIDGGDGWTVSDAPPPGTDAPVAAVPIAAR